MQALSDIYSKRGLYLISAKHLLDLPLYFDLKFKSFWESCGMKSVSLIFTKWFYDTHKQKFTFYLIFYIIELKLKSFGKILIYLFTIII